MQKLMTLVVLASLLVPETISVYAQQHEHSPVGVVRGADHPERIPESVALRTYLIARAISSDADDTTKKLNELKLLEIGLNSADLLALRNALMRFRSEYDALSNEHNQAANMAAASGRSIDTNKLTSDIAQLVARTRQQLVGTMSTAGFASLIKTLEHEKFFMTISESEAIK